MKTRIIAGVSRAGVGYARVGNYRVLFYPEGGSSAQILQELKGIDQPGWVVADHDEEGFPPALFRRLVKAARKAVASCI